MAVHCGILPEILCLRLLEKLDLHGREFYAWMEQLASILRLNGGALELFRNKDMVADYQVDFQHAALRLEHRYLGHLEKRSSILGFRDAGHRRFSRMIKNVGVYYWFWFPTAEIERSDKIIHERVYMHIPVSQSGRPRWATICSG